MLLSTLGRGTLLLSPPYTLLSGILMRGDKGAHESEKEMLSTEELVQPLWSCGLECVCSRAGGAVVKARVSPGAKYNINITT